MSEIKPKMVDGKAYCDEVARRIDAAIAAIADEPEGGDDDE